VNKVIYSIFDYSGEWNRPYREAGYIVIQIDLKYGIDIFDLTVPSKPVYGILGAPDCTDFTVSGAQYWKAKDADGRTAESLTVVNAFLDFVDAVNPVFWCMENPVGRLPKLISGRLGKPVMYFNPCDYGDAYTKKTCLWGKFNTPIKNPVEPVMYSTSNGKRGSWYWKNLGGKSERTKELRSITPSGFAKAFYEANK